MIARHSPSRRGDINIPILPYSLAAVCMGGRALNDSCNTKQEVLVLELEPKFVRFQTHSLNL
jgi:hypothetical protein